MLSRLFKGGFFYGWVIVIISLVISINLLGARHIFGIFFKSIGSEFGLTRATTSAIFSVSMALSAIFSILGGWALDKYGPRLTISLMGVFTCMSLLFTAWANSVWQLYISYSLLLAIGTGETFTVLSALVSRWFHKKRGRALGISSAGGGLGTIIMSPLATYLMINFDWRTANMVIAIIAGLFVIPLAMFLRGKPDDLGLLPDGAKLNSTEPSTPIKKDPLQLTGFSRSEAIKSVQFWLIFFLWICEAFAVYFVTTHIVPHATDVGISPIIAAQILSLIGLFQIIAGLVAGYISDVIGRKSVAVIAALIGASALFMMMWSHESWLFYLFAILFGLGWGGISTMVSALCADIFGVRSIGAIMGVIGVAWFTGAAIGPVVGGLIFDINQSYFMAFLVSGICLLMTALFAALVSRPRKTA